MFPFGASDKEHVQDLTKEFVAEAQDGLDRMERCLTALETRPRDPALIADIFRAVHSIKGATGFLGFPRLETLAHAGESLLSGLRDGRLEANAAMITGLLDLLDGLRRILALIDQTGTEGVRASDEDSVLIAMLQTLDGQEKAKAAPVHEGKFELLDVQSSEIRGGSAPQAPAGSELGPGVNDRSLRVDVDVLNRMMNLVGELVLTRNQILQANREVANFAQLGRRLDAVTTDLRETVMQARLQPVGNLFQKFPRMVRDLAKTCGRLVRVECVGQETGLDKSLLEAMKDPLTHAVRNAVDHGIEAPGVRVRAGKQAEGVVRLKAFQQGGAVVIEVTDDGGGIPVESVRAKGVETGLVTAQRAAAMTEHEVLQMIFLPGFSTAAEVTNISGRGVGMDVVRANVEKVGGTVEIESERGTGTTLRMRVPLTLAIIPALVVKSGGESFALPQSALWSWCTCRRRRPRRRSRRWVERSSIGFGNGCFRWSGWTGCWGSRGEKRRRRRRRSTLRCWRRKDRGSGWCWTTCLRRKRSW